MSAGLAAHLLLNFVYAGAAKFSTHSSNTGKCIIAELPRYTRMSNFYFLEWHFFMTNNFVLTRFLREKRLSNAQGRRLCEANAGHAPRAMVI